MKRAIAILYMCMLSLIAVCQSTQHHDINVALLGDSNTWLGGDDCSKPKGWNTYFKKEFGPKSCVSLARSGATWTNTDSTRENLTENSGIITHCNVIYNQVCRLKDGCGKGLIPSPDLIIIAAGTNDGWFTQKRPGLFDMPADGGLITSKDVSEITTLAESVVYSSLILMESFPNARIVLLTPMQSTAVPNERISQVGDIIEQCGTGLGIPVFRQDVISKVKSDSEKKQKKYTYDGTHTSVLGAQENGKLIAQKISQLYD